MLLFVSQVSKSNVEQGTNTAGVDFALLHTEIHFARPEYSDRVKGRHVPSTWKHLQYILQRLFSQRGVCRNQTANHLYDILKCLICGHAWRRVLGFLGTTETRTLQMIYFSDALIHKSMSEQTARWSVKYKPRSRIFIGSPSNTNTITQQNSNKSSLKSDICKIYFMFLKDLQTLGNYSHIWTCFKINTVLHSSVLGLPKTIKMHVAFFHFHKLLCVSWIYSVWK